MLTRIKGFFSSIGSSIMAFSIVAAAFLAVYVVVHFGAILLSATMFRDVQTRYYLYEWTPPRQLDEVEEPVNVPFRDLEGLEITIGMFWVDAPIDYFEETYEHRRAVEEQYNFTSGYTRHGYDLDSFRASMETSISNGNREINVWAIPPEWFFPMYENGLIGDKALHGGLGDRSYVFPYFLTAEEVDYILFALTALRNAQ